jgi:Protein of unknown function (DUF3175)
VKARSKKKWSRRVTETSNALTVEEGVFSQRDPRRIANSLKRSAERSHRRKADPYRSAMSMLTFYVNRGGKNISASRKRVLESANDELRELYEKNVSHRRAAKSRAVTKPPPRRRRRRTKA